MAFLEKHESSEYDSYIYTTELAKDAEAICRFVETILAVEQFTPREVVAFTADKRYHVSRKNKTQERWMTILLGKLGTGMIRAVVVDGQYDNNDCEIGIGVKTGHVCITFKKGEGFDFRSFFLTLGLIEDDDAKEERRSKRGRKTLE